MANSQNTPLTDAERAELEELRAEKARREDEERARRERAELEALRAECAAAEAASAKDAGKPVSASAPASQPASSPKTFGQRMVTSDRVDEDGLPGMPPAQKIIIAICLLAAVAFAVYSFINH